MAKGISYTVAGAIAIGAVYTFLGLPIPAFRGDISTAVLSHASDDAKQFATFALSLNAVKESAVDAKKRAIDSLLQNSYTRRDLLRAEKYHIESNKTPPTTAEDDRILNLHRQQTLDSIRDVSRNICELTDHRECD